MTGKRGDGRLPLGASVVLRGAGDDVDLLAAALIGLGIEKGDRVGIWAPNCPEWTLTQFATRGSAPSS